MSQIISTITNIVAKMTGIVPTVNVRTEEDPIAKIHSQLGGVR